MISPLELYERALDGSASVQVRFADGGLMPLPTSLYMARANRNDRELLDGVHGPVLDVGCGPGRHLRALSARGVYALGVDLSPVAVEFARRGGARAMVADVFGEVPGTGEWATALLLDGNIGIGGAPERLLARLAALLRPGGTVLAELEAPSAGTCGALARIEAGTESSDWFPWARVSVAEIAATARRVGMTVEREWQCGERWFARLRSTSTA